MMTHCGRILRYAMSNNLLKLHHSQCQAVSHLVPFCFARAQLAVVSMMSVAAVAAAVALARGSRGAVRHGLAWMTATVIVVVMHLGFMRRGGCLCVQAHFPRVCEGPALALPEAREEELLFVLARGHHRARTLGFRVVLRTDQRPRRIQLERASKEKHFPIVLPGVSFGNSFSWIQMLRLDLSK